MLYVVQFEDKTGTEDLRRQHMQAHLAFLDRIGAAVQGAGPLFTPEGEGAGGLWLVEAESAEAVERRVREDPFWPTGLRKRVTVLEWRQVFRDGRRLA